jgi:formamidopyrimidine-DNA glycosylase
MPELPEVETTVRGLKRAIVGKTIEDVWTDLLTSDKRKKETVANPKYFPVFRKQVRGRKILSVERRAKNILINLSQNKTILVHLKMTGHLLYGTYVKHRTPGTGRIGWLPRTSGPLRDPYNRFVHVVFTLSGNKHLAFSDMRKFGKMTLLDTRSAHDTKHLNNLGPEPLGKNFNHKTLIQRFNLCKNKKIKAALMDQGVVAGIGNIYSDEILWRAGIHPERKVGEVKNKEIKLLFRVMKDTLRRGIRLGGDSTSDYRDIRGIPGKFHLQHRAYGRTGEKCGKGGCGGVINRRVIGGRSAHFCSMHQK